MGSINLVRFPHPSSCADRLLGVTSDYLCFNGKMAEVVGSIDLATKRYSVQLIDKTASMSMIITACKIISYVTIVIPLIVFAVHCMLRSMYDFSLVSTDAPKGNVDPVEVESESDAESLNGVRKASDQDRDEVVTPLIVESDRDPVEVESDSSSVENISPFARESESDAESLNRVRKASDQDRDEVVSPLMVERDSDPVEVESDSSSVENISPVAGESVDPVEIESESDAESLNGVRKASDQDRDAEVSPSDSGSVEDDSASARVVLSSNAPKGNVDPVETETVEDDEVLSEENRVRKLVREGRTAELVRKGEFFSIINDELKKMGSSFSVLDFVGYSLNGR